MTHLKLQKLQKGDITQQHIDIKAMCWFNFRSFRCVIRRQLVSKPKLLFTFIDF